jgi:hypothetical protein
MKLTSAQIEKLASRKGVRRIAVENFLMSCPLETGLDMTYAYGNLEMDAASYKWNAATVKAISQGIALAFVK